MHTVEIQSSVGTPLSVPWRRWAVVGLLALASVVAYIDRINLSVALIDVDFKTFFLLGNTDRGLVNSAFFWSYAVLQIPAGWIVDRYGSKYPIALAFAVWSALTALTALTTGFWGLFAIRLLLGVAEAVIHPGSLRWIGRNFSERQRGLAIGLFMSGSKFGPAIGATVSAWLIQSAGWRAMFVILGGAAMLWLVPWLLVVKSDRDLPGQVPLAVAVNEGNLAAAKLVASPLIWGVIIGTFCYMYFVYFCLTWMPAYYNEAHHLSLGSSSLYTTFSFAGMAVVAIFGGWAADRVIASGVRAVTVRKAFTIAGFLLASTALLGVLSTSLNTALVFSMLSLGGLGLATANYWALTQALVPGGAVGRIVGIQNCAASVAGIVAPILTGWLVDATGNFDAPIKVVAVVVAVGVAAYVFLVREKYTLTRIDEGQRDVA